MYDERRQVGKAGDCRLHQRHIIAHVVEQIVTLVAYIIDCQTNVTQQNDKRQCLILDDKHQNGGKAYDIHQSRQVYQQKIADETANIHRGTQFCISADDTHSHHQENGQCYIFRADHYRR